MTEEPWQCGVYPEGTESAVMEANRKPQTASGDEVNVDMEATAKRLKEAAEIRQR